MNRWRQMLEDVEPVVGMMPRAIPVPARELVVPVEAPVLDADTLLLCQARRAGYPRLRLQDGVYVCEGAEMWRRFVRTAEPEWLEKAERALTLLISADGAEGTPDGN